jgi:hypothetical protein
MAEATVEKTKRTRKPADPNAPKPRAFVVYTVDGEGAVTLHAATWNAAEALVAMENVPGSKYKSVEISGRKPLRG